MAGGGCRWKSVEAPVPCEGDPAAAAMLDCVLAFWHVAEGLDMAGRLACWESLVGQGRHMAGLDSLAQTGFRPSPGR